jgi:hypothetical protein
VDDFQIGKMDDAQIDGADSAGKRQPKLPWKLDETNLDETATTTGVIEPFQLPADWTLP